MGAVWLMGCCWPAPVSEHPFENSCQALRLYPYALDYVDMNWVCTGSCGRVTSCLCEPVLCLMTLPSRPWFSLTLLYKSTFLSHFSIHASLLLAWREDAGLKKKKKQQPIVGTLKRMVSDWHFFNVLSRLCVFHPQVLQKHSEHHSAVHP